MYDDTPQFFDAEHYAELLSEDEAFSKVLTGTLAIFGAIIGVILLISLVLAILKCVGLYKMAKTCRVPAAWLAWIPVGHLYVLGAVAEEDSRIRGKKVLPYRILLPVLSVLTAFGSVAMTVYTILQSIFGISSEYSADMIVGIPKAPILAMTKTFGFLLIFLLLMAASLAAAVLQYVAMYKVYHLFGGSDAVLYIVLSIFLSISVPIIFFILRNKQPIITAPAQWAPPAGGAWYQPPQPGTQLEQTNNMQ